VRHAVAASRSVEQLLDHAPVDQVAGLGFGPCPLELAPLGDFGEVQQRSGGGGDRDVVEAGDVAAVEVAWAVDRDARNDETPAADDRHVDRHVRPRARKQPPEVDARAMAEDGAFAAGQRCAELERELGRDGVADEVDAAKDPMKPACGDTTLDTALADPRCEQLLPGDQSPLAPRDPSHGFVGVPNSAHVPLRDTWAD
jgi:hypothetical protein